MAEMLLAGPSDHPQYDSSAVFGGQLLTVYRKQMKGLLDCQSEQGPWRQLLDVPDAWPETSGTAMIVFALATGVRERWLPEQPYRTAAERRWLALANYVVPQGRLKEVCIGTGGRTSADLYLGRDRKTGDEHGQAPLLWAATAMIELQQCPWLEGNRTIALF